MPVTNAMVDRVLKSARQACKDAERAVKHAQTLRQHIKESRNRSEGEARLHGARPQPK